MADTMLLTQRIIAAAATILGVEPAELFGCSFAELGGSSLDASRLMVTLMRETGVRLRAVDVMLADDFGALLTSLPAAVQAPAPAPARPSISPGDRVPLTWQQKIVWFQTQLEPTSPRYYFHATLHFETRPDVDLLRERLAAALRQHPVLRIQLERAGRDIFQVVPPGDVTPEQVNLQEVVLDALPTTGGALIEAVDGNRPFDLSAGPLVRWRLIQLPGERALLLHTEHHLVHDGVSFMAFLRSLDDEHVTQEPDYGYFAYALAQRPAPGDEIARVAEQLAAADLSPFPARGELAAGPDLHLRVPIPGELLRAVEEAARRAKTSTFAAFLAANVHAVGHYRGARPFVIPIGTANRTPEHNDTVGMFVSMVPARVQHDPAAPPVEHLRAVNEALQQAVARSELPIQEIVRAMGRAARDGNSLFTTGFSMLEQTCTSLTIGGVTATPYLGLFSGTAKFPLDAVLLLSGTGATRQAELFFEGQSASVSEDDIWAIWTMMVDWLRQLSGLTPPPAEPAVSTLVARVAAHAARQPGAPALVDDAETISYAALLSLAGQAGALLGGRRRVGIVGASSARYFAVAFAALYAGAAYVPLPVEQSVDRLAVMARSAACDLLVVVGDGAAREHAEAVQARLAGIPLVTWEELASAAGASAAAAPSDEAAYVIFTSGSTGVPNGVLVQRSGLDRLCEWVVQACALTPAHAVGQWASVGFDASALEVWPALWAGSCVRTVPRDVRPDPVELMLWLAANVESVFVISSLAELLAQLDWPASCRLQTLMTGGETLHAVPDGLPFRVLNGYGPTETTIYATAHWVAPDGETLPPIGRPFPYVQARVVAAEGQLVREGVGELWLGGAGVALGYAGDAWKTAARFIPDPYSADGRILYRTGDIVYQDAGGVLHFRGRRDRQVKIDGVRLELGEIEAAAMRQPGVRIARAAMVGTRPWVYIVTAPGRDQAALTLAIRRALPAQVRHLGVRYLDELPLTASGKIDTRALAGQSMREEVVYE